MAAHNPALTQLLAALNAAPHAGMGNDFFAHVGSSLALARSVPPEWFPRSGTATAAQIGGLIARLHTLTTVAWAAYPLNGANDMTSFCTCGVRTTLMCMSYTECTVRLC